MDINRFRYFIAVVDEGNISKAALKLKITQPSLSIMIKRLEEELDTLLFKRKGKRLILTTTGRLVYQRAKNILNSTDDMLLEIKEHQKGLRGEIKIGCSTAANLIIIPKVVERLQAEMPNVTIKVVEGNTEYIANQLLNNQLDVAIVRTTFREEIFETYSIITEPVVACMHHNHPLATKEKLYLEDFSNERFLLTTTTIGHGLSDYIIEKCKQVGFIPKVSYWGSQATPMIILASKGTGITFVPKSFEYLPFQEMPIFREIEYPSLYSHLELITLKGRFRSTATEQFLKQTLKVSQELNAVINPYYVD
ncbi:LysR family transcriptional regulator [Bacillus tianshenii]|nr:LysR family transcriptional regulator [Bacillus tianshenii]